MMPNITLGGSPANPQQKGERSAKNGEIDGMRFDEALTIRSAERKATKGDGYDGPMDTRQDWKIDRYTALFRLDKTADGKAPSDTPAFGDFLGNQEASAVPQQAAATGPKALVDNAPAEPNLNGDDNAETDDASASTDLNMADGTDTGPAFASPQASTVREQAAKTAEPASVKTAGDQDAPKNPAIALGANAADADADDTQPRATVQSDPSNTSKAQAAQVSAAERAAVPAAPADGQPARTRIAANAPVNAAVAEKPAPATQPPTTIQQEGAQKPTPGASTSVSGEASGFVSAKEGSFARSSAANPAAANADPVSAKVNVLNFTAAPAPAPAAPPILSTTAAGIVAAVEAEGTWRTAAQDPANSAAPRGTSAPGGVNTLRIQLQPVELGMVTARLVASGSQLSIEIQVESNDARQRLANDSEVIVKALRAIGYDIDKVTIQQGPQNSQSSVQQGASGRNDQMQPDQQADRNARGRGDQGASGRDGGGARNGTGETMADRAGGGRYI
ncbi:flagellar hook-length control protein FliK [Neoaquamicrobium sediminum]|uniref:flagellar hook-length control protein FliK n=1 Tax=Neoaquamicrobium sediminum TaxID=1849104 RepID=UPI003BAD904A